MLGRYLGAIAHAAGPHDARVRARTAGVFTFKNTQHRLPRQAWDKQNKRKTSLHNKCPFFAWCRACGSAILSPEAEAAAIAETALRVSAPLPATGTLTGSKPGQGQADAAADAGDAASSSSRVRVYRCVARTTVREGVSLSSVRTNLAVFWHCHFPI